MKITVGITTFNRLGYLKQMRQSLYASWGLERCHIRIYDDCSSEFTGADLLNMFPEAKDLIKRKTNLGSCGNMRQMYLDFLQTGDDLLVTADSDLLFRPDWIDFTVENFQYTDGIMSLYNSALHGDIKETVINGVEFVEKEHLGAAGVVLGREIVKEIVNNVPACTGYDWAWSAYLRQRNIRLLAAKESYVQHIGLVGEHCDGFATIDVGLNFYPLNKINEQLLVEFFQTALTQVRGNIRQVYNTSEFKAGRCLVFVLVQAKKVRKRLKKLFKRVIKRPVRRLIKRIK